MARSNPPNSNMQLFALEILAFALTTPHFQLLSGHDEIGVIVYMGTSLAIRLFARSGGKFGGIAHFCSF